VLLRFGPVCFLCDIGSGIDELSEQMQVIQLGVNVCYGRVPAAPVELAHRVLPAPGPGAEIELPPAGSLFWSCSGLGWRFGAAQPAVKTAWANVVFSFVPGHVVRGVVRQQVSTVTFASRMASRSSLYRCGEATLKASYQSDQSSLETGRLMSRDSE
jgi:hypothetical protein